MTTFTMRYVNGHFVVIGPDVSLMRFKSRAQARDWCKAHYPGSPIKESGTRRGGVASKSNDLTVTLSPDDTLAKARRKAPGGKK
jgi:hypothetical protein